jgi:hypothetical protein
MRCSGGCGRRAVCCVAGDRASAEHASQTSTGGAVGAGGAGMSNGPSDEGGAVAGLRRYRCKIGRVTAQFVANSPSEDICDGSEEMPLQGLSL